jgi:hypothetical protein
MSQERPLSIPAPPPVLVGDGQPPLANDRYQGRTRADGGSDHLGEVIAGLE